MQKNILSHFDVELKSIIRTILRGTVNGDDESVRDDGALHSDSYYDLLEELNLFEAFRQDRERRNEEWTRFWLTALHRCQEGPTLFYTPTSVYYELDDSLNPPKLFRTFDKLSSGLNNVHQFASAMSADDDPDSRRDFLQLPLGEAANQLHDHLTTPLRRASSSDNLVSWTSSQLFAIQYAIYQCHQFGLSHKEVNICMAAPQEFPRV
ncbi:hypothetical protein LEL_04115 [Akanthomyces lecanii RCEF 1005]|uniref:Uncharacterized protein n=1 Tax=Akanthomyces lecanii RCEF 1005 TaxID=1081108 RepID=A0A162K374_CORDF|nr:hypothetical protein LEL_04115 [Akanthomyces lecanii RCEF 1005]